MSRQNSFSLFIYFSRVSRRHGPDSRIILQIILRPLIHPTGKLHTACSEEVRTLKNTLNSKDLRVFRGEVAACKHGVIHSVRRVHRGVLADGRRKKKKGRDFQSMCRWNISVWICYAINTIICLTLDSGLRDRDSDECLHRSSPTPT